MNNIISTTVRENFANYENNRPNRLNIPNRANLLVAFITFFVVLALLMLLGKYLWNNILVELVPGVKKANSVWQIVGLYILISLLFGR